MCDVLNIPKFRVKEMAGEVTTFANNTRLFNVKKYLIFLKSWEYELELALQHCLYSWSDAREIRNRAPAPSFPHQKAEEATQMMK